MKTNKKHPENKKDEKTQSGKTEKPVPQREWDVEPGERDSDPARQQQQREWEDSHKKMQEYAERPGVDESDLRQHDDQGNPTDRGEDLKGEM